MNIGGVYTRPTFIARGMDHPTSGTGARDEYWKGVNPSNLYHEGSRPLDWGVQGHAVNIGRVYTPPTFIAKGMVASTGGIGPCDECCKGVHPSNIHREGYRPLDTR